MVAVSRRYWAGAKEKLSPFTSGMGAANFGLMRGLTENVTLYAKVGHSVFSDDFAHTYLGVGLKLTLNHRP
jgi:hypothetical protein